MVADVTIGTAIDQQSKTASSAANLAEDFAQFLNLLTVQLQNQDPLDPMETGEFTTQLVAFTGVEQQINMNQKLDSLVSLELGRAMSSSLDYIGKDITYISSEFYNDGSSTNKITYALNGEAIDAKIRIYNEAGEVVFEQDAVKSAGSHDFEWDGTDNNGQPTPEGTYEVRIDALDIDDQAVSSTIVVSGNVSGIETQNGVLFAIVGDRAVSLANILNANLPKASQSVDEILSGDDQTQNEANI